METIIPTTHDLGEFKVRRTLPSKPRRMVGPFIFVDQFGPARLPAGRGMDVRPHPHINLATVTYLFEGAIEHRDSIGSHQVIEPGAVNLMTAGSGIVHSERSPAEVRPNGPSLYGMQTWLALPDGKEELDPAFEHIDDASLPLVEGEGVSARVLMGSLWGKTADVTQHSETIYADIILDAGASVPIDAEADERAVLVTEGDAAINGDRLEPFTLYVLAPGEAMTLQASSPARIMLLGGEAFPTQRHVFWNFVSSSRDRINQAKEDWKAGRFPLVPGDEEEFIPLPEVPLTVTYPVTHQRKVGLSTGITMNVSLAGPEDAPPVILMHGFPESHRTWRRLVPLLSDELRLIMPDLRGFGESDRPQDVGAYATDTLIADIFALADVLEIDRFALVGHDWGGAIAWAAALRGNPRISRLAIVNSPHPLIFQKSLVEDKAQRAASQYIRAFRDPDFEKFVEAIGFEAFFDKSFRNHVDLAAIPESERQITIEQWSRPGALTAMLNWYRASQIVVPTPGIVADVPDWVLRAFPKIKIPVRVVWGLEDKALLPMQLEAIGETGDDVDVFPLKGVGHFAPWEAPDEVAAALKPFLAGR